jgi:pyruvate dehydrogenase E2 component (dihydrolipoamide acetyltransferase)
MSIDVALPSIGENITHGEVVGVLVREGDTVAAGDAVLEIETEKAVLEIPCPHAGRVVKVLVTKGQTIEVGQLVLDVETDESVKPMKTRRLKPQTAKEARKPQAAEGVPARRGTREPAVPPGQLAHDTFGPVRRQPMSDLHRTTAAEAVQSVAAAPQATSFDDADITELDRLCKTVPAAYLGPTVKLSTMPLVVKAVALALRQNPALNASLDAEKAQIVYKQYVNLGIVVETPGGAVVPVLRGADQMDILTIARELTLLSARARSAEFAADALVGGSFTISNLGEVGGAYGMPIVRPLEAAILLAGRSRWRLGICEGKIEGRLMLPLSLSYDCRVVAAAAAARFLCDVIDHLQSPGKLLLAK